MGKPPLHSFRSGVNLSRGFDMTASTAETEDALSRILESEPFQRSKRNSELLAHLVKATMRGQEEELNGTAIAQDVFGKGSEFDPASDPSVRVQMGRLRRQLTEYYETDGRDDPVRIEIPKGSYVPIVEKRRDPDSVPDDGLRARQTEQDDVEEQTAPQADRRRALSRRLVWAPAAALLLIVIGIGAVLYRLEAWPFDTAPKIAALQSTINDFPVVVVRGFENRTGDPDDDAFARGFQRQFAADLQRFNIARIALDQPPPTVDVPGLRARADFIVTGAILETEPTLDVIVWLVDVTDASLTVADRMRLDVQGEYRQTLESFSQRLSAHFAAPRGKLATATFRQFGKDLPDAAGDLAAFRCLSLFNDYASDHSVGEFDAIYDCLKRHSDELPNNGSLLAALSWMTLLGSQEAQLLVDPPAELELTVSEAHEIAKQAVAVDPANDQAHIYLGLAQWFLGFEEEALASMRRAVTINPADPQHHAHFALYSALAGNWTEALPLAEQAIEWDLNPPGWYRLPFFFHAVAVGSSGRAEREIGRGASRSDVFDPIYRLVAASMGGDDRLVERFRERVVSSPDAKEGDALRTARRWLRSREVIERIEHHLRRVGVPVGDEPLETETPS